MTDKLEPQFICMTCKTVIGPIWDDYENQCKCKGEYDYEVWRVDPIVEDDKTDDIIEDLEKIKRELEYYHYDSTKVSDLITKLRGK